MTGSAEGGNATPGGPAALLADAAGRAVRAADGRAAGVYLPSGSPGVLRLAVLVGLPVRLYRPWWRLHADRRFPVSDAYRLGVTVMLPNTTESMRRYPQFAAALPYAVGTINVPVMGKSAPCGVLTVLVPPVCDVGELLTQKDRLAAIADELGVAMRRLDAAGVPLAWDDEPLCLRPPGTRPTAGGIGRFDWHPATDVVTVDDSARVLMRLTAGEQPCSADALVRAVAAEDADRLVELLQEAARGKQPSGPLHLRTAEGAPRLVELWCPQAAFPDPDQPVGGIVLDTGSVAGAAADQLPQGVFCLDRLGLIVYANQRAAELLAEPRARFLGQALWEGVPWLGQPACEDHLRAALLSPEPVHFRVRRPPPGERACETRDVEPYDGDWLSLSVHPGPDLLTCVIAPAPRGSRDPVAPEPAADAAADDVAARSLVHRPIALAIALTEATTARQVSAVVMQEVLPAFGGRRLAIYLLQERHLYLAWETGFPPGFLAPFEGVGLDARLPGVETLTTGRPLFFDSMRQLADTYPGIPLDAVEGARAFLPLIASGRPIGSCILGFDRPRSFSTEERTVLTALAGLVAHAMEKAQRYETEAALARGLQRALLPRRLPVHPRVETAGRYLPGTQGMDVGGDWYDVVEAGDGLALVIGDVQGHGVQAAATMGQLRSAVRAFALDDRPPDEVMSGTNHLLIDLDPGQFATCCYVRLDPVTGLAMVARAGHPPPLLRRPGGRTLVLDLPGGVVLGVDPLAQYPVSQLVMDPGAVLALYTDGLVERAGCDIDEGISALRTALAKAGATSGLPGGRSLLTVADRLTATARRASNRPDDIALLLAARRTATVG
ncbi:SpoIIE family protein phosphatase [Streptomyces chromofuscus]|uniref:protein-serine/threonine phosphatase n=1 Tax=Streptomyces chromofuscus TaxID=42881 RepID=A0A7M2TAE7_STRCW|nr:SpoIIE family protein phosphatase [Streptomyces chromofuscus]QOV44925.1 SpoIIE family protein phosphatase [Streptomyces chromofuscus]GGT36720.1 diguanylate cyclase [Streptomyces chromofuscus]